MAMRKRGGDGALRSWAVRQSVAARRAQALFCPLQTYSVATQLRASTLRRLRGNPSTQSPATVGMAAATTEPVVTQAPGREAG